jgi:hypothetical protein
LLKMSAAAMPYRRKSYHSMIVPMILAKKTRRISSGEELVASTTVVAMVAAFWLARPGCTASKAPRLAHSSTRRHCSPFLSAVSDSYDLSGTNARRCRTPFPSTSCYNTTLTIDRNTKRVYLSFTRTQSADKYDKIMSNTCGMAPRTQVLMNCTGWPRIRKQGQAHYRRVIVISVAPATK